MEIIIFYYLYLVHLKIRGFFFTSRVKNILIIFKRVRERKNLFDSLSYGCCLFFLGSLLDLWPAIIWRENLQIKKKLIGNCIKQTSINQIHDHFFFVCVLDVIFSLVKEKSKTKSPLSVEIIKKKK